jgi:hypothetical protein
MEMWWPEKTDQLDVSYNDESGEINLVAPPGTPEGEWLRYWSETEERINFLSAELCQAFLKEAQKTLSN